MLHHLLVLAFTVSGHPESSPIDKPLQKLIDVAMALGASLAVLGLISGGIIHTVGSRTGHMGAAMHGQEMMKSAAILAVLSAAAAAIVTWLFGIGALVP